MSVFNGKTDKPRLMTAIGYARVSTGDQDTALQLDALRKAGCERLFEDKASGVKTDRPGLAEAIRYVRDGDTLTVWKLDRLGRSMKHLIEIITELEAKGVGFRSITENIDTTTSGGRLVFHLFGALAQFDSRRTLAVCFWSNEENGYDGADRWIDNLPAGVTVTNYLNIDSAGVNYPGEYTLVIDIIPETDNKLNEQWEMISLTEWIGTTFYDIAPVLRNGRELYYTEGYAAMKDHNHPHPDTISVHESQRGRSDYVRFADRLGVVSLDFGAITGGYDCYHAPCDTLPEMVDWMATANGTGQQNLVGSLDMIAWWFAGLFWYLDERPVYDRS